MSNVSEEKEGNLLRNVKAFYTKGSFKSESQKREVDSPENAEKTQSHEVVSPDRGKRRRVKSKRYSGFQIESLKRNELQNDKRSLKNSPLKYSSGNTVKACPKSRKQQKVCQSLELVEPKIFNKRQQRILTVPLDRMLEYPDFETASTTLGAQKTAKTEKAPKNCSLPGSLITRISPAVCKDLKGPSVPLSNSKDKKIPKNPTKMKRKHALCGIFDDIWGTKTSEAAEKPQINGFKQMLNDAFNKAPQVLTDHSSFHTTNENQTETLKKEDYSFYGESSEPTQANLVPVETKLLDCPFPEVMNSSYEVPFPEDLVMNSDIQPSHEIPFPEVMNSDIHPSYEVPFPEVMNSSSDIHPSYEVPFPEVMNSSSDIHPSYEVPFPEVMNSSSDIQSSYEVPFPEVMNSSSDIHPSHEVEIKTESSCPFDFVDDDRPASWLHSVQSRCAAQSKLVSLQLFIKKTFIPVTALTEHRKKRKQRCRKRKAPCHVTDADDEDSDGPSSSIPRPCTVLSGPLKLMTLEDLWIQKEFYLRYLCNYYHVSSEGCKGWLISRLHQFILQSVGSSFLSKHKTFKLFRTPQQRPNRNISWVKLTVERKTKLLDE
ncbi:titin homolog [Bolinopsis microptera]|uniref:titin homolog n=1 Tax=Bolinopsis microptera TaxID=2820187 RepID=UPI003079065C